MRFDSRRFLEACYSVDLDDPDDAQWSCRVLRSIAVFDRGCGLVAGAFDSDAAESERVRLLGVHGERGRASSHWHRLIRAWAPRLAVESLQEDRVGSSTVIHVDGDGRRLRDSSSPFVEPEALDALILMDLEGVGKGVFVGVPYAGDRVPPKQVVERLSEMVWHLGAGRRFRSRLAEDHLAFVARDKARCGRSRRRKPRYPCLRAQENRQRSSRDALVGGRRGSQELGRASRRRLGALGL